MDNQKSNTIESGGDGTNSSPVSCSTFSTEQMEILKHANKPSSRGQFVGASDDMDELVALSLMRHIGRPSWCPDEFYEITEEGKRFLSSYNTKLR